MTTKTMLLSVLGALVCWGGFALDATAANLLVPSEYLTIQAAIDASVDGDVVLVAPGEYTGEGNRDLDPGSREITILGEAGPDETLIDCESQGRGLWVHGGQTEAFQFVGFTVRNGAAAQGAGFRVDQGSKVTVADCVFDSCAAGGFTCFGDGIVRRTRFSNCSGDYTLSWQTGWIVGCEIVDNAGWGLIVAHPYPGELLISRTVVSGNDIGGAWLGSDALAITVEGSVLSNNRGETSLYSSDQFPIVFRETTIAGGARIELWVGAVEFDRCILSGLACDGFWNFGMVTLTCCLFDPDYFYSGDPIVEGGQVDADPRYCEPSVCGDFPSRGDYALHEDSPCLPENSPCGQQIGAFGLGCGVTAVDDPLGANGARITFTSAMPARDSLRFRVRPGSTALASTSGATSLGPFDIEIVTLTGRRIAARTLPAAAAGTEFEWRPEEDGTRMDSGIYFLRATGADGSTTSTKFVWLH